MQGFATATVLLLASLIASVALWASQEALSGSALATARTAQLRAQALNAAALAGAMQALATLHLPLPASRLRALPPHGDVRLAIRRMRVDALPEGFSTAQFVAEYFELVATASSPPGARTVVTQGAMRVVPAGAGR